MKLGHLLGLNVPGRLKILHLLDDPLSKAVVRIFAQPDCVKVAHDVHKSALLVLQNDRCALFADDLLQVKLCQPAVDFWILVRFVLDKFGD